MTSEDVTALLLQLADGDEKALDRLLPVVYDELRMLARSQLRRNARGSLDTTGLVHEAYLRMVDGSRLGWESRQHFLAVFSLTMRSVIVDLARRRAARKRGGDRKRVQLDDTVVAVDDQADEILAIDQALAKLAERNERLSRTVECRFFAGLSEEETATVLGVTSRTVRRDWVKAKAFLYDLLHPA